MTRRHKAEPAPPATLFSADVSERGLLGAILLDGSLYGEIGKAVAVGDFASARHRVIFTCIQKLDRQGSPIGLITVAQELDLQGQLEQVGDHAYLDFLTDGAVLSPSHVKHLARTVRRVAKEKEVIRSLETIADASARGETLERTRSNLSALLTGIGEVGRDVSYVETGDGILWRKPTRDGWTDVLLTNFQCRILAEVTQDDGVAERRVFELECILGGRHVRFSVTAAQFNGMNWATENLGARAIIFPGFGLHQHARVAIQTLSSKIDCRRVYEHTGWRNLDGSWVYLHGGGAITEHGVDLTAEVNLPDSLKPLALPAPPDGNELLRAVRASLRMLDVAPDEVIFPLLAAVYRAPLGACDFTLHLAGSSGVGKSALAALAQQHFGAGFDINRLPGSWLSTANALAHLSFTCKDALLVVDDFAPTGNQGDVERFHRDADRLLRGQGNGASRARLRSDGSLRPTTPPRGLILSTGEDVPRGQSLRARILVVQVAPSDLKWHLLTPRQNDAGTGAYAKAMAAYLRWLAPQYNDLVNGLRTRLNELRSRAAAASFHRRTPEIVANLALGLEQFIIFAEHVGAISEREAAALRERGWKALTAVAAEQTQLQNAEEPTRRFLELLSTTIRSGEIHLVSARTGDVPADAAVWGWSNGRPLGKPAGWVDGEETFLVPGAAFAAIQRLAKEQNAPFPVSEKTLWKRMAQKKLLISHDHDHNTIMKTLPGGRCRVLHLPASLLVPTIGASGAIGETGELADSGHDGNLHRSPKLVSESVQTTDSQLSVVASPTPIEPLLPIFRPAAPEINLQLEKSRSSNDRFGCGEDVSG